MGVRREQSQTDEVNKKNKKHKTLPQCNECEVWFKMKCTPSEITWEIEAK